MTILHTACTSVCNANRSRSVCSSDGCCCSWDDACSSLNHDPAFGSGIPELQAVTTRILTQCVSASAAGQLSILCTRSKETNYPARR